MPTVADFVAHFDRTTPPRLAAEWDNVGLLAGDPAQLADRVMTCLTLTPAVAAEAVERGAQLVVTHHPILFRGAKRLTAGTAEGRMMLTLIEGKVAVYSPHTAFDNAPGGINDRLAALLGLEGVGPLRQKAADGQCKLVVFVPESDLGPVSDALFRAGAGRIGAYRECSFRTPGTGTFFGEAGANPTVGSVGRREEAAEVRLEVVCPAAKLSVAVAALRAAHSYEEPAFDIVPQKALGAGEGRVGDLPTPQPLGDMAAHLRAALKCGPVAVVGAPSRRITRVAVACGAAGEFLRDTKAAGADAFLVGEMRFHDLLAAQQDDIGVLLPGHYASERFALEQLAGDLGRAFPTATIWASEVEADPLVWPETAGG